MPRSLVALAALLVLFSASVSALSLEAPSSVTIKGEQRQVQISLINDSSYDEEYSIELISPAEYSISREQGEIDGDSIKTLTLTIYPSEQLAGNSYEGTLLAEVGDEKIVKRISLHFQEKQEEEEPGENQGEGKGESGQGEQPALDPLTAGFFSLSSADYSPFFTFDNALNIALATIAAVLLIAFISRLVKRVGVRK